MSKMFSYIVKINNPIPRIHTFINMIVKTLKSIENMNCLLILIILFQLDFVKPVVVRTGVGDVLGKESKTIVKKKTYYAFKSIRYAEPPERFEPPVPVKPWFGIYNATQDLEICYQLIPPANHAMSEDCLYLSVYTPKLQTTTNSTKLPVMVYVSGGFFLIGNGLYQTYTPDHLIDEDVIIVTCNYRLGAFGFLSTGDSLMPGNNGIKDVLLVIKWVHENIIYFGGDPKNVTFFGQSAGASIISYLTLSDTTKNKGYFQKIILQSGSALHPFAYQRNPKKSFEFLKTTTGCSLNIFGGDRAAKNCLKRAPAIAIGLLTLPLSAILNFFKIDVLNGLSFAPVFESASPSAVITRDMYTSLKSLKTDPFDNITIFIGTTSEEAALFDPIILLLRPVFAQVDLNNALLVPQDMYADSKNLRLLASKIRKKYIGNGFYFLVPNEKIIRFVSDAVFNRPWREYMSLVQSQVPTYCYLFSYPGKMGGFFISKKYQDIDNVGHGAEILYLFDSSLQTKTKFDPQDFVVRKRVIKIWTNFAKTGNPTPFKDELLQNIQVPAVSGSTTNCLNINSSLEIINNPRQDGYKFWKNLYDTYGHPRDTY